MFFMKNFASKSIVLYIVLTIALISVISIFLLKNQDRQVLYRRVRQIAFKKSNTNYEEQQPLIVNSGSLPAAARDQQYDDNYWDYNAQAYPPNNDYYNNDYQPNYQAAATKETNNNNNNNFRDYFNSRNYVMERNNAAPPTAIVETTQKPLQQQQQQPARDQVNSLISVLKTMKMMWDFYQALTTALYANNPPQNATVIHPRVKDHILQNKTLNLENSERQKRETAAVQEGRYIKGDPLKGYYDFVITEGSYKFWAVFQVGTAILIIYSTFAAIYYTKVNPLVSDYDYTDYLGGARSFNTDNLDFEDVDDSGTTAINETNSGPAWYEIWLPKVGKSLQNVVELVDKFAEHKRIKNLIRDVGT